jgi:hypothetical protein
VTGALTNTGLLDIFGENNHNHRDAVAAVGEKGESKMVGGPRQEF